MRIIGLITTAGLLCGAAGVLPVLAADYGEPIDHGTPRVVEYGSGWYLRGDIGYAVGKRSSGTYYSSAFGDDTSYSSEKLNHPLSYTIGFGYHFNEFIRADLTIEHSDSLKWEGRSKAASCGTAGDAGCAFEAEADLKRTSIMANGYASLGRFGGFKPYIGGGIGVSDVSWSNYDFQQYCVAGPAEDCGHGVNGGTDPVRHDMASGSVNAQSGWAMTYALAAGVEYQIDKNWTVDVGYKWTRITDHVMLKEGTNGIGGDSSFDNIDLHEAKLGLRYDIW